MLAVEFLYEFIWLSTTDELRSLLQSLRRDADCQRTDAPARQLSWYIKSLWLSMASSFTTLSRRRKRREVNDFRTLFNNCHALRILRIRPATFQMDFSAVSNPFTSLRFVEVTWNYADGIPSFSQSLQAFEATTG
jgi:hypothetical protein